MMMPDSFLILLIKERKLYAANGSEGGPMMDMRHAYAYLRVSTHT